MNFPTRIQNNSATAIDISMDTSKSGNYIISTLINGLSDHDAQFITLHSYTSRPPSKNYRLIRDINDHTINDFLNQLSCETWDNVLSTDNVNIMFNSFLDTYLKMFYSSFLLKRVYLHTKNKNWITLGILTSCKHKRELFNCM